MKRTTLTTMAALLLSTTLLPATGCAPGHQVQPGDSADQQVTVSTVMQRMRSDTAFARRLADSMVSAPMGRGAMFGGMVNGVRRQLMYGDSTAAYQMYHWMFGTPMGYGMMTTGMIYGYGHGMMGDSTSYEQMRQWMSNHPGYQRGDMGGMMMGGGR